MKNFTLLTLFTAFSTLAFAEEGESSDPFQQQELQFTGPEDDAAMPPFDLMSEDPEAEIR